MTPAPSEVLHHAALCVIEAIKFAGANGHEAPFVSESMAWLDGLRVRMLDRMMRRLTREALGLFVHFPPPLTYLEG